VDTNASLSSRILNCRKKLGSSQAAVARACGVHTMTVSKWERGVTHPDRHVARLASVLGVSVDYLLSGKEEENDESIGPIRQLSEFENARARLRFSFNQENTLAFCRLWEVMAELRQLSISLKPKVTPKFNDALTRLDALLGTISTCTTHISNLDPELSHDFLERDEWPDLIEWAKSELSEVRKQRLLAGSSAVERGEDPKFQ
jgi:transcriptional regulator with XRE-family HTH domain